MTTVASDWTDLQSFLAENPDNLSLILYHHERAIKKFYEMDSSVVEGLYFNTDEKAFINPNGYGKIDPVKFSHLIYLIENYTFLYKLIRDEKKRERAAVQFQSITCNQKLTQELLEKSFDPRSRIQLWDCWK